LLRFLHNYAAPKARERAHTVFSEKFFLEGLKRRCFKGFKLYAEVAGNKHYQRRLYEKVTITIDQKVVEKKNQFEFLEAMVRELEEKYRIELRKKAILKSQCDQAYLRGASAISIEALKMSHSTLSDYYRGMKMPTYNGQNVFTQIRNLNSAGIGFEEVTDPNAKAHYDMLELQRLKMHN